MMKSTINKFVTGVIRDLIILIALCFILVFLWFSKGLIFAGGEEGIPFYDLNKTTQIVAFTWQDASAGYPSQLLLNRIPYFNFLRIFYLLGLPGFLIQALHFLIIMSFGTISLYFLLKETIWREMEAKKPNKLFKIVPLIGAIFYLLNPFSMTQIWGRGLYMQFFPYALFPFFLLMFILGLRNRNFIFGIAGLLASVFFAGAFGNPSYIFSFWIIIFIYLSYHIFINHDRREVIFSLSYLSFMLVGWVFLNMWWIYPFLKMSGNQFAVTLSNTEENLGTLRGISKDYQLPSLLRLIHEGYFFRDQKYGESYLSFFFNIISWIIPIMAFISYYTFKKLKIFVFFAVFLLFSLFICLGSNLPAGKLFVLIFKTFPVFQAFRNPFEKFGIVLTLAYAPFFAVGITVFANRVGRITLPIILFLVFGIFLWPIWTGQFAGGVKLSPWVKVPDDYRKLNLWLSQQPDDGRIIHFPINPGDGLRYSGWQFPYQGIEPGEYIFTRSSIGKYGLPQKPYYKFLMDRFGKKNPNAYGPDPDFSHSEFKSDFLYQELAKLNVRYIILHYDIDPVISNFGEPQPVADYLKTEKDITKLTTFGKLDVYRVDVPENVGMVYSPDIRVTYEKINPTLYKATAKNIEKPFDLYLLQNYDDNWAVYVNGVEEKNHQRVFSYANKWRIQDIGDLDITVKYKPQDFISKGMEVTKIAILIAGMIILVTLGRRLWSRKKA